MSSDRKVSEILQPLATGINDILKAETDEELGFFLLVFNTTEGARTNYVSNCKREEVVTAIEELLQRWKDGMPDVPGHEVN